MQRKFILNLILLIFLNLLVKPFYILGIDTEFIVRLGQASYGNYFALMNLTFMLNIFLDFGIVNFNTSNLAKHAQLVSKHFSSILMMRLMLALIFIVVTFVCAFIIGYRGHNLYLLGVLCLNQILAGLVLYFRSNLAGLQLFVQDGLLSVVDRLVLIVLCSAVLWGGFLDQNLSIELFIYIQTLAYSAAVLTGFFLVLRKTSFLKPAWRPAFSYLILKKSMPYALLILLMGVYYRTDGIMLERMLDNGAYEAGIYAQAFRFFEAGNMLAYLFVVLLFPMFARMLKQKEDVQPLLDLSFKILTIGALVVGMAGYYFSEEIMDLRYDTEITNSANAFKYLMIGFIGVSGTYVFGAVLTANENLRALNYAALGAIFLNIVLNLLLIPSLKAEGAAIASMTTQLLMTALQIYLVQKYLKIKISLTVWTKLTALCLILSLMVFGLELKSVHWMLQLLSMVLAAIIFSLLFNLLSVKSLVQFIQTSKNQVSSPSNSE